MSLCINQSGTWRNITTKCVNGSGTWRKVLDACVNQSGTWRCYGMTAPTVNLSASPATIVRSGGEGETSTLSWSTIKATTLVSSNFGASSLSGSITVDPNASTTYCMEVSNAFANTLECETLTVVDPIVGCSFAGGTLISRQGSVNWIVAPDTSEVSREWTCRDDAVTTAQQVSGCTGWFVPTCAQLLDPGYACNVYWDSFSSDYYWSSSTFGFCSWAVDMSNGSVYRSLRNVLQCVRAFRCVTY